MSAVPVTSAEASEARKTAAPMMSSTSPARPSLIFSSIQARAFGVGEGRAVRSVRMKVGQIGVHADAVAAPFDGHRLGEAFDRVLGGGIDGAVDPADMGHLRRDVDEDPGRPPRSARAATACG
jgi:hypothetical protein